MPNKIPEIINLDYKGSRKQLRELMVSILEEYRGLFIDGSLVQSWMSKDGIPFVMTSVEDWNVTFQDLKLQDRVSVIVDSGTCFIRFAKRKAKGWRNKLLVNIDSIVGSPYQEGETSNTNLVLVPGLVFDKLPA